MKTETIVLNAERNVTLTAYTLPVGGEYSYIPRRPAILVIPGGGYQFCSDREAEPIAMQYLAVGYQAFILRYSLKENAKWPNPLEDYEQAMAMIRARCDEWNLYPDKVAVIGFSAGGHLAGAAATMSVNRPNAAILGYAVLMGETAKECEPTAPDLAEQVDDRTCPCFLFASRADDVVPIQNSLKFMDALDAHDISFESHIYSYGPHGFSTAEPSMQNITTPMTPRTRNWVKDSIDWLAEVFGTFGIGCMTDPVVHQFKNADHDETLSVGCSLGRVMQFAEGRKILEPLLAERMASADQKASGHDMGETGSMAMRLRLHDILGFMQVSAETIQEIDAKLCKVRTVQE